MALIYDATLSPSKPEILRSWAPTRPWFTGAPDEIAVLGAYRFDDPLGEVGIEVHLIGSRGRTFQVPLTYRGAPLEGADASLVTTMEHSVLGRRWVYDGAGDPVFAQALATVIITGGREAELHFANPAPDADRAVTTRVRGSGEPGATVPRIDAVTYADDLEDTGAATIISAETNPAGGLTLRLLREVGAPRALAPAAETAGATLAGTWPGQRDPALLATAM